MTITSFKIMNRGPIKVRPDRSRHGRIEWLVTSDDIDENQNNILNHADLPELHVEAHPDNPNLIAREYEVEEFEGNDYKWIVTGEFDTKFDGVSDAVDNDPTATPVRGGITSYTEQRPVYWDAFGNPLVNKADDYYEGVMKRHRLRRYNVTAKFTTIPDELFELAGTINNATIVIHGKSYQAGVALLDGVGMPDAPLKSPNGTLYWPISYDILIDMDGWVQIYPNRGYHEYQYQTRTVKPDAPTGYSDWKNTGYDAWDASSGALRQKVKLRILDDADGDIAANIWLNDHGEKMLASLSVLSTTGSIAAGSTTLTATLAADDAGKYITVAGAGFAGRTLRAQIVSVSGGTAVIKPAAGTTVSGAAIKGGGAWANAFQVDDLADWSNLPLPDNH